VKAGDLYTKEELERLERGYKKGGKVAKVMHEFGEGKLHSGSKEGPKVTSRKQAVAIALSEAGKSKKAKGGMAKHEDEAMDKALIKKMVKPGVLKKAMGGMANSSGKFLRDPKSGRPTGLGPVVLEPPRRPPAPAPAPAPPMPPRPAPAPPRPAPAPPMPPPAPMMGGRKSLTDPISGRATGLGPLVQEPPRPAAAPPAPPMRRAEGGMASIKSPLQRMSRAKGVPVASEMPMIESKSSGPKSIGVNAKRPGGPNVGAIRAAMARAASKAVPENAPSMMKKGGKVK